jgi:hypothetical protein
LADTPSARTYSFIPPHDIEPIWVTTNSIMLYIAAHLLAAGGAPISELQMKILLNQAEKMCYGILAGKIHTTLA